jgi:predicted  nucleic acid-binding Zn-ribbon protein
MMAAFAMLLVGTLGGFDAVSGLFDRTVYPVDDSASRHAPPFSSSPPVPAEGPSVPGPAQQQALRDAWQAQIDDLKRQDDALRGQIAQHRQELAQRVPSPPAAEQQAARDALQRQIDDLQRQTGSLRGGIADLQRQDSALRDQIAQRRQQLAQRTADDLSASAAAQRNQQVRDAQQRQIADLQHQIAELQQQDNAASGQLAQHRQELAQRTQEITQRNQELTQRSQELAQRTQELAQRTRELDATRLEADKLRQSIEALRQQQQAEESVATPQNPARQQVAAAAVRTPAARTIATPQQAPARQPVQPATAPPPEQAVPAPSTVQQLETARQWLSAGRPDEARRVLAMVQTQMVFQPVTPDQPTAQGGNPSATSVGDAIRWLDKGATRQAMQSITRALDNTYSPSGASPPGGPVRAWSGYAVGAPSGSVAPPPPPPAFDYYRR